MKAKHMQTRKCLPTRAVDVKSVKFDREGRVLHMPLKERVEHVFARLFVQQAHKGLLSILVNLRVDMPVKRRLCCFVFARQVYAVLSHLERKGGGVGEGRGGWP